LGEDVTEGVTEGPGETVVVGSAPEGEAPAAAGDALPEEQEASRAHRRAAAAGRAVRGRRRRRRGCMAGFLMRSEVEREGGPAPVKVQEHRGRAGLGRQFQMLYEP